VTENGCRHRVEVKQLTGGANDEAFSHGRLGGCRSDDLSSRRQRRRLRRWRISGRLRWTTRRRRGAEALLLSRRRAHLSVEWVIVWEGYQQRRKAMPEIAKLIDRAVADGAPSYPIPPRPARKAAIGWTAGLALLAASFFASGSQAAEDDALKILKGMSDYLASQKTISLSSDSDIEVITPDIQKIQFASSGQVLLSRPDKLRATRTGGYADVEIVFDGKTASVLGKDMNAFTQLDAPGPLDQLIDKLRNDYSVALPGADLLASNAFDVMSADVLHGDHIGRAVVNGFECEHLAFRNDDTDWQLWVQVGDAPIPRKYVITSKTEAGAPQYTLVIRDWKADVQPSADAFAFKAPDGAKKLDAAALSALDEVPPGSPKGEKK
jgi:hypothetical protein